MNSESDDEGKYMTSYLTLFVTSALLSRSFV